MKTIKSFLIVMCVTAFLGTGVFAQQVSLALMPVQTAFVKGDVSKFRAMNWVKDGAQSGVKSLAIDSKVGKDVNVSFEGSGMLNDDNYSGDMLITKDEVGYIKLSYGSFVKYSPNNGVYYSPLGARSQTILGEDLSMDIGDLTFEIGKGSSSDPDLAFSYERKTKNGLKNSSIYQSAWISSGTTNVRKVAPTFIEIDDVVNVLTLKGKAKVAGFNLKGDQKYSYWEGNRTSKGLVVAPTLNTSATADGGRVESIDASTKEFTTTLRADRWTVNDRTYIGFGYRYQRLHNEQLYNYTKLTTAFALPTTYLGSDAKNVMDSNVWTGQLYSNLTDKLSFSSGLKLNLQSTKSRAEEATVTYATGAKSGVEDYENENRVTKVAENVSLKYAAFSKATMYADLEMKQERNWRSNIGNHGGYEAVETIPENMGTLGVRIAPIKTVNITTEYKHGRRIDRTNTLWQTDDGTTRDFLFYNKVQADVDVLASRLAWKPVRWLQGAFRYTETAKTYHIDTIDGLNFDPSKTSGYQRDFVYGLTLLPNDQWMFDLSYSIERSKLSGIPSQSAVALPPSTSNVDSVMFSTTFAPTQKLSFYSAAQYSRARNTENEAGANLTAGSGGANMLYDIDAEWYSIETGLKIEAKKDLTVSPHYAYQAYREDPGMEMNDFSAHVIWVDVSMKF
ncbi:MAG: hypothetical protein HQL21_00355 [Candidatus Omnitrophica bacterium]|nr:hypothetical protein [Candidatus Omnitrophota bacterium]